MATTDANTAIFTRLSGMQAYKPASATILDDWTIEPGDIVKVQSGTDEHGDPVYDDVPVFQLDMKWNGAAVSEIQATGSEKRPPLSPLKRRNFSYGHGISQAQKTADEAVEEVVYISDFTKTDRGIGMLAQAIGVKIDEDTGLPAKDEHGEYMFDGVNGATLTGTLSVQADSVIAEVQQARGNSQTLGSALALKADSATLISQINGTSDNSAIAYGKLQVQPGNVLIKAINGGGSASEVTISADKVNLEGYVTATQLAAGEIAAISVGSGSLTAGSITATDATLTNITSAGDTTIDALYLGNSTGTANYLINSDLLVKSLSITPPSGSGTDYTLTWTTADGVQHDLTFSRATSLDGVWSGGVLTVTATPQGETYVDYLSSGTVSYDQSNPNIAVIPITHSTTPQDTSSFANTGSNVRLNITSTTPYTTAMANVTVTGIWSGGVLTASNSANSSHKYYAYLNQGTTSWSGTTATVPITYATTQTTDPSAFSNTGKNVTVSVGGKLTTTTVTPTSSQQTVTPSGNYIGFSSVTVEAASGGEFDIRKLSIDYASDASGSALVKEIGRISGGLYVTYNGVYIGKLRDMSISCSKVYQVGVVGSTATVRYENVNSGARTATFTV